MTLLGLSFGPEACKVNLGGTSTPPFAAQLQTSRV